MTEDLRAQLAQIATAAAAALPPVEPDAVRSRLRRRRAARRVAGAATALVLATSAGAAAVALDAVPGGGRAQPALPAGPTADASPTSTPTPTTTTGPAAAGPVPGWVPGGGACGTVPAATPRESPTRELLGRVVPGMLDTTTAMFAPGTGTTLLLALDTVPEVPGEPAQDGLTHHEVLLVDAAGTVAWWNDPARQVPQTEATDGSGATSLSWLYDGLDCRTGRPLDGTYRVLATDVDETVELAPVALGSAAGSPDVPALDDPAAGLLPTCGEPLPEATRRVLAAPDLVVTLDPAAPLGTLRQAGVHVDATVTAAGSTLRGYAPQALRGFLVDDAGTVVSQAGSWAGAGGVASGTVVETRPGSGFAAEVYQGLDGCTTPTVAPLAGGAYDLYVLDAMVAADESGRTDTRTIAGGPYRVTVSGSW